MADLSGVVAWGSDVPVSMPEPLPADRVVYVDMDGFCFTLSGLGHNFTETDLEIYTVPTFSPDPMGLVGEVRG